MVTGEGLSLSKTKLLVFSIVMILAATACSLPTGGGQNTTQQVEVSGPPEVRIVSPANNATYLEGVTVPIQVSISNAGVDIERVEVSVDGAIVATFPAPNPSGARIFSLTQPWPISATGTHAISVTAFRGDGTASTPAEVSISIVSQAGQEQPAASPTNTVTLQPTTDTTTNQTQPTDAPDQPTDAPDQPTNAPDQPTDPPPPTNTNTPNSPMAHMLQGVNVRSGPDTSFPKIGSLAANVDTEVLAVSPGAGWYKIVYYNGEGWVYAPAVQLSVDVGTLTIDAGPPTPAPTAVPATAVPATAAPTSNVNLVVTNVAIGPHPFICGNSSSIQVTVTNNGSAATTDGGAIWVEDFRESDNVSAGGTEGIFPILGPGESHTAQMFLQVDAFYGEGHVTKVTIDSNNQIAESNENDNTWSLPYVLSKGGCP